MMGYSPTQKRYKLLNLTGKTIFVSRDVVFKENIFIFVDVMSPMSTTDVKYVKLPLMSIGDEDIPIISELSTIGSQYEQFVALPIVETEEGHLVIRSTRTTQKPHWQNDYVLTCDSMDYNAIYTMFSLTSISSVAELTKYYEAAQHSCGVAVTKRM